jgi:hypothetical protein
MFHSAVSGTGKTVLVVRGLEIIGKGQTAIARGTEYVGVRLTEGKIMEEAKDLGIVKAVGFQDSYFRFSPTTGGFASWFYGDSEEDTLKFFEELRIVDEFNLRFGLVPDEFKDVPGYRSAVEREGKSE